MPSDQALLRVHNLGISFGGLIALKEVSFDVARNSITALIGPNGAGKTTVFNCLTGFYKADADSQVWLQRVNGSVNMMEILGESFKLADFINPLAFGRRLFYKMFGGTHQVNRVGLARTFQNTRLFKEMTAVENLLVAQHVQAEKSLIKGVLNTAGYRRSQKEINQRAYQWLDFFGLQRVANRLAGELPYGMQKRLEIARALCTNPQLLCLDEPAAGLNPAETSALSEVIRKLRKEHAITVLIIEHDMGMVMTISDKVVVLDHGEVLFAGTPDQVKNNPEVIAAYLGEEE